MKRIVVADLGEERLEAAVKFLKRSGLPRLAESLPQDFRSRRRGRYWSFVVAIEGERVIGLAEYTLAETYSADWAQPELRQAPQAWIGNLVADPDYRRRGVGESLVEAVRDRASAAGCTFLALWASPLGGDDEAAGRRAFFGVCGLRLLDDERAIFGASLSEIGHRRGR